MFSIVFSAEEMAIANLEKHIYQERVVLQALKEHYVKLAAAATHRNHFLPINRLPNELLSEIFILSQRTLEMAEIDNTRLTLVCTRWRGVANATLRLFRRITLRYERNELVDRDSYLRQYLENSGEHRLEVLMHLAQSYEPGACVGPVELNSMFAHRGALGDPQLARSVMARCFSLEIVRPSSFTYPVRTVELTGSYPQLRHLSVMVGPDPERLNQQDFSPLRSVTDCANLESIAISGPYYFRGFPYSLAGPGSFDSVTRVSLRNGQNPTSVGNLLSNVPNLVFLSWYDEGLSGPDFVDNSSYSGCHDYFMRHPHGLARNPSSIPYNLPHLRELRLSGAVPIMTLRLLEAPSLQSAALFAYASKLHDSRELDLAAAKLVVDRLTEHNGWPLLNKLELYRLPHSSMLSSVLLFQENLEELTFHHVSRNNSQALQVIGGLVNNAAKNVWCPHLTRLTIKNAGEMDSGQMDVLKGISARRKAKFPDVDLTIEVHTILKQAVEDPMAPSSASPEGGVRTVRRIQCTFRFPNCNHIEALETHSFRRLDIKPGEHGIQGLA